MYLLLLAGARHQTRRLCGPRGLCSASCIWLGSCAMHMILEQVITSPAGHHSTPCCGQWQCSCRAGAVHFALQTAEGVGMAALCCTCSGQGCLTMQGHRPVRTAARENSPCSFECEELSSNDQSEGWYLDGEAASSSLS